MIGKKLLRMTGVLAVVLTVTACAQTTSGDTDSQEERTTPVQVAEVTKGNVQNDREIIGTAAASTTSEIIPKASGELVELTIEKGDIVEKGQVIGQIDAGTIQDNVSLQKISVQSAQKQLESAIVQRKLADQGLKNAEEQLKQAEAGNTDKENSDINISIENAKLQLDQAEKNLERMKALYEQGAISLSDLEQAQVTETQAKNAYEQAKNGTVTSDSGIVQAQIGVENAKQQLESAKIQVESAQLQVDQAQIQLSQTQDQLGDTSIKAKAAGEITALNADVGDMLSNTQALGTIISLNPIQIDANISGEELSLFEKGKQMTTYVKQLDITTTATITYVSPVTDDSGLYLVEAELANKDEKVKPGMMATFQLPTTIVENSLLVPTTALVEEADGTYLFVIEEERAVKMPVTIINSQSDISAIEGDINVGDQVVTSGQITLSDGNKVSIIEEAAK